MCIILYKPKNVPLPSKQTLKNCFDNNDDGIGFCEIGEMSKIHKGFMDFEIFYKFFMDRYDKKKAYAIHFRIGTSGGNIPQNTHPFPISGNEADLKELYFETRQVCCHNGILGNGRKNLSDTMYFIKKYLYPLKSHLQEKGVQGIIAKATIGSKLLIIDQGKVHRTGTWFQDKGIFYSNKTYKREKIFMPSSHYSKWDFCDYLKKDETKKPSKKNSFEDLQKDDMYCPSCMEELIEDMSEIDTFYCPSCGEYWINKPCQDDFNF